jgi:hypothetical protein
MRTRTAVGLLTGTVPLLLASRTLLRDWGVTKHEQSETLPGDWLENLFGLDIHNADEVRPEWQRLSVHDVVRLVPAGALGLAGGLALPVQQIAPPQTLVLRVELWHAVWSVHVRPVGPPGTSSTDFAAQALGPKEMER